MTLRDVQKNLKNMSQKKDRWTYENKGHRVFVWVDDKNRVRALRIKLKVDRTSNTSDEIAILKPYLKKIREGSFKPTPHSFVSVIPNKDKSFALSVLDRKKYGAPLKIVELFFDRKFFK